MTEIHPTAIVSPDAELGEGTRVGAFAVIDANVVTGKNCVIANHTVIRSHTTLGNEVQVFPFAVLGEVPQHLGFKGEPSTLEVGNRTIIRESATLHRGTELGGLRTVVGDDCLIMAYVHVAHDCHLGNKVIIANSVQLAGHVTLEDQVNVGGVTGITQYVRVGRLCFVGAGALVRKDMPPFTAGKGNDFRVQGLNLVGLRRSGIDRQTISALKKVHQLFFQQNLTVSQAIEHTDEGLRSLPEVSHFLDFVKSSKLGIYR